MRGWWLFRRQPALPAPNKLDESEASEEAKRMSCICTIQSRGNMEPELRKMAEIENDDKIRGRTADALELATLGGGEDADELKDRRFKEHQWGARSDKQGNRGYPSRWSPGEYQGGRRGGPARSCSTARSTSSHGGPTGEKGDSGLITEAALRVVKRALAKDGGIPEADGENEELHKLLAKGKLMMDKEVLPPMLRVFALNCFPGSRAGSTKSKTRW